MRNTRYSDGQNENTRWKESITVGISVTVMILLRWNLPTEQWLNRISTPVFQKDKPVIFRFYWTEELWLYTINRVALWDVLITTTPCLTYRGRCWGGFVHPQYKVESYHVRVFTGVSKWPSNRAGDKPRVSSCEQSKASMAQLRVEL